MRKKIHSSDLFCFANQISASSGLTSRRGLRLDETLRTLHYARVARTLTGPTPYGHPSSQPSQESGSIAPIIPPHLK